MKKVVFIITFVYSFSVIWIKPLADFHHVDTAEEVVGMKTIIANKANDKNVLLIPNIVYTKTANKSLKLHLLIPKNETKPCPLLIFIKGSGWGKDHPQETFAFIPQLVQFAKSGFIVASIEHRTSRDAKFPAQLYDVKAAVRYLKANAGRFNIDPTRVGIWGSSSGGHLAALVGTSGGVAQLEGKENNLEQSSNVQAVVDWYGPTDFLQMSKFPSAVDFDAPDSPESVLIGGPLQKNKEKVRLANPISYISADDPPFLIMHGDKDSKVPFNQSVLLFDALKKADVEVTMYRIKGAGHGGGFSQPEIINTVQKFFDLHLKRLLKGDSKSTWVTFYFLS